MSARAQRPALDRFRLLAAVLVVCIHTGPLSSAGGGWDFWLTRVLARTAVPFFLMVSGYFLAQSDWKNTGRFLKKTTLTYLAAVALYLPLNLYNGGCGPLEWVKKLLVDGTLYHLWYFPAVLLGVVIVRGLIRLGKSAALAIAVCLYLIGLGGDSYYGLAFVLPVPLAFYGFMFQYQLAIAVKLARTVKAGGYSHLLTPFRRGMVVVLSLSANRAKRLGRPAR